MHTLPVTGEDYLYSDVNWNVLQGWFLFHILWNAKHFSMFVDNNHLIWFNYTDILISINHSTADLGYWQICIEHIFTKYFVSPVGRHEVKWMWCWPTCKLIHFVWFLPLSIPSCSVLPGTPWNVGRDLLKFVFCCCNVGQQTCKTLVFHGKGL